MRLQPLFSLLAESRHIFGCRPKPRAAKSREKLFARVTIKTWQKPETALEKSLAPRSVKMDLSNMKEKPWQSCERWSNFWGKYFKFLKAPDRQGLPTQFWKKTCSQKKKSQKEGRTPDTKQQGRKRNIQCSRDTIPTPSVHYERSFNEKVKSHTKPITTLPNLPIISFKKGKSWQRTCLLEPKYEGQTYDFTPV